MTRTAMSSKDRTAVGKKNPKESAAKQKQRRKPFQPNYDYEVDYNDHFETPQQAYTDILPLLDSIGPSSNRGDDTKKIQERQRRRKEHILYDPYYCNGRTKVLLRDLGFDKVVHEKRDFYKDIRTGKVPHHHTLVTNPPYSDDHKERCLQFCVDQFRTKRIAFFLLIPSYVAARNYYRRILGDTIRDVCYLVPGYEYEYSHPEGTGHEESPFASLWFCCIGKEKIHTLTTQQQQKGSYLWSSGNTTTTATTNNRNGRPKFIASFDQLISEGVISLQNRPNPRQRKKMRKLAAQSTGHSSGGAAGIHDNTSSKSDRTPKAKPKKNANHSKKPKEKVKGKKRSTTSKYRNTTGERTKKRF